MLNRKSSRAEIEDNIERARGRTKRSQARADQVVPSEKEEIQELVLLCRQSNIVDAGRAQHPGTKEYLLRHDVAVLRSSREKAPILWIDEPDKKRSCGHTCEHDG